MRSLGPFTAVFVVAVLVPSMILAWIGLRSTGSFEGQARELARKQSLAAADRVRREIPGRERMLRSRLESASARAAGLLRESLPVLPPSEALAKARGELPPRAVLRVLAPGGSALLPRSPGPRPDLESLREWNEFAIRRLDADRLEFALEQPLRAARTMQRLGDELAADRLQALAYAHAVAAFERGGDTSSAARVRSRIAVLPVDEAVAAGPAVIEAMLGDDVGKAWVRRLARAGRLLEVPAGAASRAQWREQCGLGDPDPELSAAEQAFETAPEGFVVTRSAIAGGAVLEVALAHAACLREVLGPTEADGCKLALAEPTTSDWPDSVTAIQMQVLGAPALLTIDNSALADLTRTMQSRRSMTIVGIVALILVLLTGLFLVRRALTREHAARRLREEFIANVSHELKTPLTSIRLHAEMLAQDAIDAGTRESYSRVVEAESARLSSLVDDLLDFAALERGQRRLEPAPVDLSAAVRATANAWEPLAHREGVALEPHAGADVVAYADPIALTRILANLMQNAWRHGRPPRNGGGPRIRILALPGPALEVRDNGPGVDAGDRERVFQRFERGRDAEHKAGAGIGLALSRELARAMAGDLEVSDNGDETVFRLSLPPIPDNAPTRGVE